MARAARSRSSPGQRPGPARTGVQSGDLLCTTRFSRDCISSLDTGGKEIEQMSRRCARLMMGPTVLPARGARHIRDRAPRVHYHRKLPLWRAQHERCVEVPADRAATAPRTLGLCATPQHLYQLARSATNPAAARERKPVNSRQARDYAAARSPAPALLSASKCSSAALPTQQAPL